MPKLRQSKYELANSIFRAAVNGNRELYGYRRKADLCPIFGVKEETVSKHLSNPANIKTADLRHIIEALKFSDEQILGMFGRGPMFNQGETSNELSNHLVHILCGVCTDGPCGLDM